MRVDSDGDNDGIQSTVVTIWSSVPWFRFLDHVKRRCPFAVGWAANPKLHHMLEFVLSHISFLGINSTIPLDGCRFNFFNVVHDAVQ